MDLGNKRVFHSTTKDCFSEYKYESDPIFIRLAALPIVSAS